MPKVSIIVPFFNADRFLAACTDSVLSQSLSDWELLLIDDGSTDRSPELARQYADRDQRIRMFKHPGGENRGVSLTRQLGLEQAAGEFIAFLDADDLFFPEKIERQLREANKRPQCGVFHTAVKVIDENGVACSGSNAFNEFSSCSMEYAFEERDEFLLTHAICNSSTLIRRSCLAGLAIGYSQFFQIEDFVLWTRLSERTRFYFDAEPLVAYREHSQNASKKAARNPASGDLCHLEYLLAIIATFEKEENRERARELLEERITAMIHRTRIETLIPGQEHPTDPTPCHSSFGLHTREVLRRIRLATQVLRSGSC